jgi:hypothetical protein
LRQLIKARRPIDKMRAGTLVGRCLIRMAA